jgi:hypothetical protein
MTTTIAKVLAKAASQIGGYFPGDSPYGLWYAKRHGDVYKNAQFCAIGLSWCFDQVDGLDIFPEHAYTPSGVAWFKSKGRWHTGSVNNIPRGAIIYFDFPGAPDRVSHVGIAEKHGSNGVVQTIEFNTSSFADGDQRNGRTVARKLRSGSSIVGWGMPNYAADAPVVAPGHAGAGVGAVPPPPSDIIHRKPNCVALQRAVNAAGDNRWGPDTDKHFDALREASNWGGNDFPFGVVYTQKVVGTKPDGKWGPNSKAAHTGTVRTVQRILKSMGHNPGVIDGMWGPKTEAAYQAARSQSHI